MAAGYGLAGFAIGAPIGCAVRMELETDDATVVRALLGHAGLRPPPEEVDRLIQLYGGIRRQLDRIYAVDLGSADPAPVFRAGEL